MAVEANIDEQVTYRIETPEEGEEDDLNPPFIIAV